MRFIKIIFVLSFLFAPFIIYCQEDISSILPVIKKLTAHENNKDVTIYWSYERPEEIVGYGIYRRIWDNDDFNYGDTVLVGKVYDPYQFSYTDTNTTIGNLDIKASSYTYFVSAIILNGNNESQTVFFEGHSTMHISSVVFDSCQYTNTLTWSPYLVENINKSELFEIYAQKGESQPFEKIGQVQGIDTSFIHENIIPNNNYNYYVIAKLKTLDAESQSNTFSIYPIAPDVPLNFEIRDISINPENKLQLTIKTDTLAPNTIYEIQRSNSPTGKFDSISSFTPTDTINYFIDKTSYNDLSYYKIVPYSNCGLKSFIESEIKAYIPPASFIQSIEANDQGNLDLIFFTDTSELNTYVLLKSDTPEGPFDSVYSFQSDALLHQWTDNSSTVDNLSYYKLVPSNDKDATGTDSNNNIIVQTDNNSGFSTVHISWTGNNPDQQTSFSVYKIDANGNPVRIHNSGSQVQEYNYDITNELINLQDGAEMCFFVVLYQTDSLNHKTSVQSNVSCYKVSGVQILPNAINPVSNMEINRKFNPLVGQATSFMLIIYDRWGNEIFKTQTQGKGWDGKGKNGNLVMQGAYVYYLQYSTDGKQQKRTGTISVIYP